MKHDLIRVVAEIHAVEDNGAFQRNVVHAAVCLMGVFPCPVAAAFFGLGELAVLGLGVDQGNVTLVGLHGGVHQSENTVSAGQSHNDSVELLAHLVDRHVKALIEGQEAGQSTQGKAAHAVQGQNTADDSADHIAYISQLGVDRAQDVGESVRIVRAVAEIVVELLEFLDVLFLVTEDFDNLLAIHHLLDEAVGLTQSFLLLHKEVSGKSGYLLGDGHHNRYRDESRDRQRNIQDQHADKNAYNHDGAVQHLRNTLADHLTESIDIVRVDGHDISVGMSVKIFDRQFFHVSKQIVSQVSQGSLGHIDHHTVLGKRSQNTDEIKDCHTENRMKKRREIRIGSLQHGHDIAVDQGLHEHGSLYVCQHADKN